MIDEILTLLRARGERQRAGESQNRRPDPYPRLYPELYHGHMYATGFPAVLKRVADPDQNGHRDITIPFGIYFTTVVDAAEAAAAGGLLVLDYQRAGIDINGQIVEVEPHGMSGGGVWYSPEDATPGEVWDPRRLNCSD